MSYAREKEEEGNDGTAAAALMSNSGMCAAFFFFGKSHPGVRVPSFFPNAEMQIYEFDEFCAVSCTQILEAMGWGME